MPGYFTRLGSNAPRKVSRLSSGSPSLEAEICPVVLAQIPSVWPGGPNCENFAYAGPTQLIRWMLLGLVRSRTSLEAENVAVRHQLSVLCRSAAKRPALSIPIVSFSSCCTGLRRPS